MVTASDWSTTYATVRTYRKDSDGWHRQFKKMNGRIGSHGFAQFGQRRQNSGETPSGTYVLKRAFGAAPDPGTAMHYRQFDSNDWWPYDPRDPRTYNVPQYQGRSAATRWRKSWAEHLSHFPDQYEFAGCEITPMPPTQPRQYESLRIGSGRRASMQFDPFYSGGQPPHNMTTPTTMIGQPTLATLSIRPTYRATNASPT